MNTTKIDTAAASSGVSSLIADLRHRARYLRQPEIASFRIGDRAEDFARELDRAVAELSASAAPRGTDAQILKERELTASAISGAIAFGQQGVNPPPSDDHWLAPFWNLGRSFGASAAPAPATSVQQPTVEQLQAAIQRAGLTLLKTAAGYEVRKLGPSIAHSPIQQAAPARIDADKLHQDEQTIYVAAHECANCSHAGINDEHPTDGMCESCDWRGKWPEDGACPSCENPSVAAICPRCDSGPYVCVADGHVPVPDGVPASSNDQQEQAG